MTAANPIAAEAQPICGKARHNGYGTEMIVRSGPGVVHLITQPDHAALARRIMQHWRGLEGHPRRESILLAVGEHDNGWREPDATPSIDPSTGRVHDFMTAPAAIRQGVWPRAVEHLSYDPWAAALVAEHALTVYDRYRPDPAWTAFFAGMERLRDALLARMNASLATLAVDYPFVRIGDLISLVFCNPWPEETYRAWTFRFDRDVISVTPDAFDAPEVPFEIGAIEVADRSFASDGDLRAAVQASPRAVLRGTVRHD